MNGAPVTRIAVVTVVAGRHAHLRAQRRHLAVARPAPDLHVVVAVGDAAVGDVVRELPDDQLPTHLIELATHPAGLPVAAARNAGAAAALATGAGIVVFLDVDCLPDAGLLGAYRDAVLADPDAIACGPVTYLPPTPVGGWDAAALIAARSPHAARPDPPAGSVQPLAPELFWSLSFAVSAGLWTSLPERFYEGYVGYGGEDTDFAAVAARTGTPLTMVGGADAYHQHHPVSRPPVEHLDDILRNAAVYERRHGTRPMAGWLDAFADSGLLEPDPGPLRRRGAVRVASIPARHDYVDAVLPPTVVSACPDRVAGWDPDPLLTVEGLSRWAGEVDVVHLHFGFDHLSVDGLAAWLDALDAHGLPLVLTVHDLRNPHHPTRERHDAHLGLLVRRTAAVLTLTDGAADECAHRFGVRPDVVPHPSLLDVADLADLAAVSEAAPGVRDEVLVPLKALRANVVDPVAVVAATAAAARAAGARVRVLVNPSALELPALAGLGEQPGVELDVAPFLPADRLLARLARARAIVLPYRFGTHSGWLELARDLGVHVVAPDCGHHAGQWADVLTYGSNEDTGLDAGSLQDAVGAALRRPPALPADRTARAAERDLVRARHDVLYRSLTRR